MSRLPWRKVRERAGERPGVGPSHRGSLLGLLATLLGLTAGCEGDATTLGGRLGDRCPPAPAATTVCGFDLAFSRARVVRRDRNVQIRYERGGGELVTLIDLADVD